MSRTWYGVSLLSVLEFQSMFQAFHHSSCVLVYSGDRECAMPRNLLSLKVSGVHIDGDKAETFFFFFIITAAHYIKS